MNRLGLASFFVFAFAMVFPSPSAAAEKVAADVLFARKILPLFKTKCFACHGEDLKKRKAEFDLRTRVGMLKGGESEQPSVVPGKPMASPLYLAVTREYEDDWAAMPPKENDKLSAEKVKYLRDWIAAGAPWPDAKRLAEILKAEDPWGIKSGVLVKTSGGLSADWTNRKYDPKNLWAYQPMKRPKPPMKTANLIDAFIMARMPKGLKSAPLADRLTLIRRVTFNLTGLPPSPSEIDEFLADKKTSAYGRLIDRLLASPRYGEQWARHWLDVVRYADSSGFANDFERPHAWRYRDYVIRAFNSDKPYDQFVREQIAGDELKPNSAEHAIAVGFLRMGPWEHTGMAVARVTRQLFLDDVTDSVGQVFLGHVLRCARCHDHKFDPIPTRDYYSMQAIFSTTQFAEVDAAFLPKENTRGMAEHRRYHAQRVAANQKMLARLAAKKRANDLKFFQARGLPYKTRAEAIKAKAPKEHIPSRNQLSTPNDFGRDRLGRKWTKLFSWGTDRYKPFAFTVYSGKTRFPRGFPTGRIAKPANPMGAGQLEQTAILKGGDLFSPSQKVSPAVLSVAGGLAFKMPTGPKGRRAALARWIASGDNPLTARVMVNRVWQHHFGRGLAGNPNNFGATGKKPTHPALLDWLAVEFVAQSWSVKKLHRLILTSEAYRRASTHPNVAALAKLDSGGASYAVFRPRRLAAEELRDAMLAVSGELNRNAGGIPARPDMNLEAALQPRMIMGTFAPSYVPDPLPGQRNRRSIYALKLRGQRDPFMTTFNQPGTDKSCEHRDSSNVTPQVFTLFNSEESADRALAFADRVLRETKTDEAAIVRAFRLALGRTPEAEESKATLAHWRRLAAGPANQKPHPRKFPTKIVRTANEENTGEPFTFTEQLFEYHDYVPDLQPHQVDARTRAFADLCLVLFNSNEFLYVY